MAIQVTVTTAPKVVPVVKAAPKRVAVVNKVGSAESESVLFDPSGTNLSSTNVKDAIIEVAQSFFQQEGTPSDGLNVGDIWYDEITEELKIYS